MNCTSNFNGINKIMRYYFGKPFYNIKNIILSIIKKNGLFLSIYIIVFQFHFIVKYLYIMYFGNSDCIVYYSPLLKYSNSIPYDLYQIFLILDSSPLLISFHFFLLFIYTFMKKKRFFVLSLFVWILFLFYAYFKIRYFKQNIC
jgi:hypothetical protein